MIIRRKLLITAVGVFAAASACNKGSKSSSDPAPAPAATEPTAEQTTSTTASTTTETNENTTEEKKTSDEGEVAAGTAGQAQQQLGLALQGVNYDQYALQPVSFIASVGTVAIETGREAGLTREFRSLRSLRSATPTKDIDSAEKKFSWEPAQDPIKNSEKIRCLVEKSGYIDALAKAMKNRPKFPPDSSDEQKGIYGFNVGYSWTTNVKQKDLKKACFSEGSSMGMGDQGGGSSSDNKMAKFTGQLSTKVTATQTGVDAEGLPEFDAAIGSMLLKFWISLDASLIAGMEQGAATGGGGGSSEQRNFYITLKVDEAPSLKNPNGKTEFNWTAYKVVDGNETDRVIQGRRLATYNSAGEPTLSFREKKIDTMMWTSTQGHRMTTEQKANVVYKPKASTSSSTAPYAKTLARTAQTYNWEPIPSTDTLVAQEDQSGSFSYVWDADSDRSLTKWVKSDTATQWWDANFFDPTAPVCRDTKNMVANVWNYGLFSLDGEKLDHRTFYTIETDKKDSWGWPINGGIGPWGLWIYGVSDGETVYIRNDQGNRVAYTYKVLPGSLVDANYTQVIPATDLDLTCSSQCPKSTITDAGDAYQAAGTYNYRYKAAQRKLVYVNGATEEDVVLANNVDNAWLSFNLTLASDSGVSYTWQVNRSRWVNAQMMENGGWFDYYSLGDKNDNPGTYTPPADVAFTCSSNCLKSSIAAADLAANPASVYLTDPAAGTPYCYVYRLNSTSWEENYKLYRDTACDGVDAGDAAVGFASDVTSGKAAMAMTLKDSSPARTIDFTLEKMEYGAAGGLKAGNGSWFNAPKDLKFQPFTYQSATYAYPGMTHPDVDGKSSDLSDGSGLTYDGKLSFGNGYLCCLRWAQTDIPNAWGGKEWGPVATFRKGSQMTVAEDSGNFKAGDKVLLAPTFTQLTSPPVNDCSAAMQAEINGLPTAIALPDDSNLPFSDERDSIGQAPTKDAKGNDIEPLSGV